MENLRIMRNEIFAKHGYIFKSEDLREYFSTFDWYIPKYEDVNHLLTEIDIENINFIQDQESKLKRLEKESRRFLVLNNLEVNTVDPLKERIVNSYLGFNRESIIQAYLNFWGFDIKAISFQLEVVESKVWSTEVSTYVISKIKISSKSESASGEAFNNCVFEIVDEEAVLKYESGIFQPECSTPDVDFISMSILNIGDNDYVAIERYSQWHACCGQSTSFSVDWLVFSNDLFRKLIILEKSYSNDNDMDCGPLNPPPPESRETNYFLKNKSLYAEVIFFEDGKLTKTEEKTIEIKD